MNFAGAAFADRMVREWLAVSAVVVALAVGGAFGDWFGRADLALYDHALAVWQRPAAEDIVIVAVDDESLAQIGRWPWPRAVHAALLDRLTRDGARAVGLDILFPEPDTASPAADSALAEAIRRNGKVVLPVVAVDAHDRLVEGLLPIAPLAKAAHTLGYAHAEVDADGLIRRLLPQRRVGAELRPHFALAVLDAAGEQPGAAAAANRGLHIAYAGPPGHFRHVSYAEVLRGTVADGFFRDRIVLIGATAAGLADSHPTPAAGDARQMSGIEIDANALDTVRRGILIRPLSPAATAALSGLTLLLLMVGLRRSSARGGLLWTTGSAVATLILSALLLRLGPFWYAPVPVLLGCLVAYPLWSWRQLEATQRQLDAELYALEGEPALPGGASDRLADCDPWQRRVAALRDAAQARRRARRFLSAALDSLPVGVLVADSSQRVVLANARAVELIGGNQRPVVNEPLAEVLRGLHLPAQLNLATLLDSVRVSILPRQIEVARDQDHPLLLGVAATEDERGQLAGLVVSLSDVAELRRAQRLREQTMRFLSHDLRSPLMSIISMIDVMQEPDGQDVFDLAKIQQTARRALNLADDVMRLARAEALDPQRFRGVDLAVLGWQAVEEVEALGRARGIEVRFHTPHAAGSAYVQGDAELLRRALINLLNNAVRHSPDQGQVRLELAGDGGVWLLTVADQGPGIPTEQISKLFSAYSALGDRRAEGTGLGLVIVKTVVERHGGSVSVETAAGAGARFVIRLARPGTPETAARS